jgi:hypothetical protein
VLHVLVMKNVFKQAIKQKKINVVCILELFNGWGAFSMLPLQSFMALWTNQF